MISKTWCFLRNIVLHVRPSFKVFSYYDIMYKIWNKDAISHLKHDQSITIKFLKKICNFHLKTLEAHVWENLVQTSIKNIILYFADIKKGLILDKN